MSEKETDRMRERESQNKRVRVWISKWGIVMNKIVQEKPFKAVIKMQRREKEV